jgi:hypothetical protein
MTGAGFGEVLGGGGIFLTSLASLIVALRGMRSVHQVHEEVKTMNGLTIGALADLNMGRGVRSDVAPTDQTEEDRRYARLLFDHEEGPKSGTTPQPEDRRSH